MSPNGRAAGLGEHAGAELPPWQSAGVSFVVDEQCAVSAMAGCFGFDLGRGRPDTGGEETEVTMPWWFHRVANVVESAAE